VLSPPPQAAQPRSADDAASAPDGPLAPALSSGGEGEGTGDEGAPVKRPRGRPRALPSAAAAACLVPGCTASGSDAMRAAYNKRVRCVRRVPRAARRAAGSGRGVTRAHAPTRTHPKNAADAPATAAGPFCARAAARPPASAPPRLCHVHVRSSAVLIDGREMRFCQQCVYTRGTHTHAHIYIARTHAIAHRRCVR
jgi:hypothetical protein